jgi:type IV secretion system protein TrbL
MNTGVIDRFTEVFTRYIDSGFGLLGGDVAFLASTLIAIDITLAGLFWAWGADEDVLAHLVKKTLYVGFFAFLIGNFNNLAKIVFNSFSGLGLKAAGSSLSADQFLQPGRLAQVGIDAGKPILDAASQLTGYVSFFANFIQIFVLLTAWLVVVVAFFILATQLFVTLIEFKLTTLAGFILVPFGLFSKTAFLAERVLGNVVASGVKVLVLAVIVGIGTTLFGEFTQGFSGNQPSLEDTLALVLAALSLLGLGIFGPRHRNWPHRRRSSARRRCGGRDRTRRRRSRCGRRRRRADRRGRAGRRCPRYFAGCNRKSLLFGRRRNTAWRRQWGAGLGAPAAPPAGHEPWRLCRRPRDPFR